jgi:NTP pyrophosphatase (non-canonical NTP hydrolase)
MNDHANAAARDFVPPHKGPELTPEVCEALNNLGIHAGKDYGRPSFDQLPEEEQARIIAMGFKLDSLSFFEYQTRAKNTAIYNQDARVLYPSLGLTGEVGEVLEKMVHSIMLAVHGGKLANQVKKIIRDDDCECDTPRKEDIGKEIGGVLWYCAAVASDLGLNLEDIARENLGVLASRKKRGTIQGDGDNR